MSLQKRSYTAGHFELAIDGHPSTAYLKSIDGGQPRASLIEEPIGPDNSRVKHISVVDVEPITFEFGMAGSNKVLQWIQASWRREFSRLSGQITHANFNLERMIEQEFYDALLCETTFPTLDGSSKDAAYLKVKMQPETGIIRKCTDNSRIGSDITTKQKLWLSSGFRFNIDGLDDMRYTNKIDGFTIKQGVKRHMMGQQRYGEIEPTKIDFPNITGTISLEYADQVMKWADDYVRKGQRDTKAQKTGSIEFLSPDRKSVIFAINLYEVGIHFAGPVSAPAKAEQIKRVKFELYVGRMDLDPGDTGGFA